MEGYFKVHRKILQSQVFAHQTALKIWIWCLARVTFKERFVPLKSGKGEITVRLMPGQFIFGRFKAEEELNIDGSTIYKWIQKFASKEFNMITIESNNQYSIITLCKWEEYQNAEDEDVTTNEQPSDNQVTAKEQPKNTNKKDNNDNNVKKEEENEIFNFKKALIDLGVEEKIVSDWMTVRKKKKGANTETAFNAIKKQIELSGATANDCIKKAVEKSWCGFESEWYHNCNGASKNIVNSKSSHIHITNDSSY